MNRQTYRKGQERERQSQLAEDTEQDDWCSGQELPLEALVGETGEENRAEERTEGGGAPEPASPAEVVLALGRVPARQGSEPHCTLAPRPSRCRMEYFMK